MAKDRDDQLNHGSDELEFSLEEILAEYHINERKQPDEALPIYLPDRHRTGHLKGKREKGGGHGVGARPPML